MHCEKEEVKHDDAWSNLKMHTTNCRLFPRVITVRNDRSTVVAATVSSHGEEFSTVCSVGPSFPAAMMTGMPLATAPSVPDAAISSGPPRESDRTSTPSWIA